MPGPASYQPPSIFESNRRSNRGPMIHIGREETRPISYIPMEGYKTPAPTHYQPQGAQGGLKYSLQGRTPFEPAPREKRNPGPGAYSICEATSRTGSYHFSKFHNSCARHWSKGRRFAQN
jgi:hypothetical protein